VVHGRLEDAGCAGELGRAVADVVDLDVIRVPVVAVAVVHREHVGGFFDEDRGQPAGGFLEVGRRERTGVVAPRGTPVGVIDRLNAEINRVITRPDVKEAWSKQGATPLRMSSAQFAEFILADIFRSADVVTTAGVRPD
jgi:hypothetical protein